MATDPTATPSASPEEQKEQKGSRVDHSQYAAPLATASENKPEPDKEPTKPYWWVTPNPSGASRELMDLDQLREWLGDWEAEGCSLADVPMTITMVWLTEAEVEALPCV